MRRLLATALAAALLAAGLLLIARDGGPPAQASHGNLNVHVHDSYYHPAGKFIVGSGTDHNLAQAACETALPDSECNAVIDVGDSITWVSPAPLAQAVHTVTECTDGTFTVCGANVDPNSPIGDSGLRAPPSPGPSGWPYGPVQFNTAGAFYYRCEVHPDVMRGRVLVLAPPVPPGEPAVGGELGLLEGRPAPATQDGPSGNGATTALAIAAAAVAAMAVVAGGAWYLRRRAP